MSLAAELENLKPRDRKQELATVLVAIFIGILAYFLDKARFFAFGLVPVIMLTQIAQQRGIGIRRTPRLYGMLILLCVAVLYAAAGLLAAQR
jgi:hypothetical protein